MPDNLALLPGVQAPAAAKKRKVKTDPPETCLLGDREREWFKAQRFGGDPDELWDEMIDWHLANGMRRVDWKATWRNWCRQNRRFDNRRQGVSKEREDTRLTDDYIAAHAQPGESWDAARMRLEGERR